MVKARVELTSWALPMELLQWELQGFIAIHELWLLSLEELPHPPAPSVPTNLWFSFGFSSSLSPVIHSKNNSIYKEPLGFGGFWVRM